MKDRKNSSKMIKGNSNWETISTGGFAPMWKPEDKGEDVEFIPFSCRIIPGKGKRKESACVECVLAGGSSDSFYQKDVKKGVADGEHFVIGLSYNLNGEHRLANYEQDSEEVSLSPLSEYLKATHTVCRIVFDGKIKGGQGYVNLFTIQTPKGTLEAMASSQSTKKTKK